MLGIVPTDSHNPYPVAATGFLLGTLATVLLFGIHISQIFRYYHRFGRDDPKRYRYLLVPVVFGLSSLHISLVIASADHYYVGGIGNTAQVWGAFYWGLSAQDLLIPIVSYVSHLFFGYRAWMLSKLRKTVYLAFVAFATFTLGTGVTFAALARIWAKDPWLPYQEFEAIKVGRAADVLPTVWLSCAALIDACLTVSLVLLLLKESPNFRHTRALMRNIVRLTIETVLLTHAIGATLFVLWLTSRTRSNLFWFLIEIIAETYALSVLFTLNSRRRFRKDARPDSQELMGRQLDLLSRLAEPPAGDNSVVHRDGGRPSVDPDSTAIDLSQIAILDALRPSVVSGGKPRRSYTEEEAPWGPISPIVEEEKHLGVSSVNIDRVTASRRQSSLG